MTKLATTAATGADALSDEARMNQRSVALSAWAAGDLASAEQAALRHLGFAPPNRASGDVAKTLPADPRYRRLVAEAFTARVRALTGGASTTAPPCCEITTHAAAADRTGFAALRLTRDASSFPVADNAWLLSPLDRTLGFVPCAYDCSAALDARAASLEGRNCDLGALAKLLAVRLLRLAPGIDLIVTGPPGRGEGAIKLQGLYAVYAAATPPIFARLVESLVVRRLLAGAQVRFLDEAIDARQGLVFVKMLHRKGARWLSFV